jgi:hypothetical protein
MMFRSPVWMFRTDPATINFDRNRALQQIYRQHELQSRFDFDYDSAHTPQRPILDPGYMTDFQVRPRHCRKTALFYALDGCNLFFPDRNRCFAGAHDLYHPWRHQHRQAIVRVHPAEKISREQRHFDFLYPIGPASHVFADGQKAFVTCIFQQQVRCLLSACSHQDREPRPLLIAVPHFDSPREATAVGVPEF